MPSPLVFPSLDFAATGWTEDGVLVFQATVQALVERLEGTGEAALSGHHDPIDRLTYADGLLAVHGTEGGTIVLHRASASDLNRLLSAALAPLAANQSWLAQGAPQRCTIEGDRVTLWSEGRPIGTMSIDTEGRAPNTFGHPPPWRFVFQGKPSKAEATDGHRVTQQVAAYLKKLAPRFVMRDDATGLWYVDVVTEPGQPVPTSFRAPPSKAMLKTATTPDKAYSWTKEKDALVRGMSLEGLWGFSWTIEPTAPGWKTAAQDHNDPCLCYHAPFPPQTFSIHRYDPVHGGLTQVIDGARFRALTAARRHHEGFIALYGAPACAVLAHVASDAPGVDAFVAILEPQGAQDVETALAAAGVPRRKNPAVQRTAYHRGADWRPAAVWSLALPQAAADALVARFQGAPGFAVASHPWTDMWP